MLAYSGIGTVVEFEVDAVVVVFEVDTVVVVVEVDMVVVVFEVDTVVVVVEVDTVVVVGSTVVVVTATVAVLVARAQLSFGCCHLALCWWGAVPVDLGMRSGVALQPPVLARSSSLCGDVQDTAFQIFVLCFVLFCCGFLLLELPAFVLD